MYLGEPEHLSLLPRSSRGLVAVPVEEYFEAFTYRNFTTGKDGLSEQLVPF